MRLKLCFWPEVFRRRTLTLSTPSLREHSVTSATTPAMLVSPDLRTTGPAGAAAAGGAAGVAAGAGAGAGALAVVGGVCFEQAPNVKANTAKSKTLRLRGIGGSCTLFVYLLA